jgi:hypothetical protein
MDPADSQSLSGGESSFQSAGQFVNMPSELIVEILLWLDLASITRCKAVRFSLQIVSASFIPAESWQVCRYFNSVIESSILVQYHMELAVAGMKDNPLCELGLYARFDLLQRYTAAWRSLNATGELRIDRGDSRIYEISGGIVALGMENKRTLRLTRLPSALRRIEKRTWEIPDVGGDMFDIAIDPAQDLLVMVELW